MGREFESTDQVELDASPEEIWRAIATGPGIDSWFMGRNEVDAAHGAVRQSFGDFQPEYRIAGWEPMWRLAYGTDEAPDGRFVAYEFLIEGRDRSSTVLRMATSGFLPGDDWSDEYDAMRAGNAMFFATLATYLTHFAGRTGRPLTVFGPPVTDWPATWRALASALGLAGPPMVGDRVSFALEGLPPARGEVYFVNSQTVGVRTADGLYRFLKGFRGPLIACHSVLTPGFTETDRDAAESAWRSWLTTTSF
ncbi:SRPBCC family protein [Actinophytocola gossypii]|uniref:SRPBCC domain-containing protein n=1 Tax=Actinophytocola gossypii TaxID=2812003 RepID=A0ABT2J4Q1_9PSEU|nr:SRPBCC domain-containing protein [Actinophytocola gossypii]MCT2582827.1 SRPBCC domain-containing protein [Actinophytocola gossypii]